MSLAAARLLWQGQAGEALRQLTISPEHLGFKLIGLLSEEWIHGIEAATPEIFDTLEKRHYPFDGSWLDWMPDPAWSTPTLPVNWDKI